MELGGFSILTLFPLLPSILLPQLLSYLCCLLAACRFVLEVILPLSISEALEDTLREEKQDSRRLAEIPFHYIEISSLLLAQ